MKKTLVSSKYVEFINRDEQIDFDSRMTQLLAEKEKSKKELKELFEKLGYKL